MTTPRTLRRSIGGAVGALTLAASFATFAAAPAQAGDDPTYAIDNCDLSRTVEQLQDYGSKTDSNVIVYRADHASSASFEGIVRQGEFSDKGCNDIMSRAFKWVIFDGAGDFVRSGDGGYRNWAFYGSFDRPSDEHVVFHPF